MNVRRQRIPADHGLESRQQAFEHERGLAGARDARHNREPSLRDSNLEGLHRMDGARLKANFARGKDLLLLDSRPHDGGLSGKVGADHRIGIGLDFGDAAATGHHRGNRRSGLFY